MTKLHPSTAKSAKSNEIDLRSDGSGAWDAIDICKDSETNGEVLANNEDPKVALKEALRAIDSKSNGEDGESSDEDEAPKSTGNVVPKKYRDIYKQHNDTCGDAIAGAIGNVTTITETVNNKRKDKDGKVTTREVDRVSLSALAKLAAANGISDRLAKIAHLNPGMQRMNVGNILRGMVYSGAQVVIGKVTWNLLPLVVEGLGEGTELSATAIGKLLKAQGLPVTERTQLSIGRIIKAIIWDRTKDERAAAKVQKEQDKADRAAAKQKAKEEREAAATAKREERAEKAKAAKAAKAKKVEASA